jgi:putative phosphoribosyl transferase
MTMAQRFTQFLDRRDAGQRLAAELKARAFPDPAVLALPRGGVPVAYEVANALDAPLDILLVRKLGAPGHEEFGIGAVVDGAQPQIVLNSEAIEMLRVSSSYIEEERDRQLAEIERRRQLYAGSAPPLDVEGRTAIVVDDGVATGGTVTVALRSLRRAGPRRIVLAIPVAPPETLDKLVTEADEVVCLSAPRDFRAVGLHYGDFTQTSDEEVISLLASRRADVLAERRVS